MLMSLKEVAEFLGLSIRTIHRLIHKGQLPASKIGGQWRVDRDALDLYIKTRALFLGNITLAQLYYRPGVLNQYRQDTKYYVQESASHGRLGLKESQYVQHTAKSLEWVLPDKKDVESALEKARMFVELRFWKVQLKGGTTAVVVDPKYFYQAPEVEQNKWRPYVITNPQV